MSIPTLGKAIWRSEWEVPGESAYSLKAKFMQANGVTPSQLSRILRTSAVNSVDIANRRAINNLAVQFGPVATRIKGRDCGPDLSMGHAYVCQEQLRYCGACMATGFHAAIAQRRYLSHCPIHDEPLHTTCLNCGAGTPFYSRVVRSAPPSFHCASCNAPFGGKGPVDGNLAAWRRPTSLSKLTEFVGALEKAWKKYHSFNSQWWGRTLPPAMDTDDGCEDAVFKALQILESIPGAVPASAANDVTVLGPVTVAFNRSRDWFGPDEYQELLGSLPATEEESRYWDSFCCASFGTYVPIDASVPIDFHAKLLWRWQFEKLDLRYLFPGRPQPDSPLLELVGHGPWTHYYLADCQPFWEAFGAAVWVAARRIAEHWHEFLLSVGRIAPSSHVMPRQLFENPGWLSRLGNWRKRGFFPVGILCSGSADDEEDLDVYFLIA